MGKCNAPAAYRELGAMLREVRVAAGLTSMALAHKLGWSLTTVSRMETGRRPTTTTDVIQYAAMCGAAMPRIQPLLEFTRVAERNQGYYLSDEGIGGSLQSLIFHESSATHSVVYEPQVIHGLLQTPDYARSLITAIHPDAADDWVDGVVRTRMERRRVLSPPGPARFTFFIHENAFRLRVGADEIMQEQLLHLVIMAGLNNVTVWIVPNIAGARSALGGAFHMMKFHEHRPIVYLEHLRDGGLILEDPDYVNDYDKLVPMLADLALDEGQSRMYVAELANMYDRGSHQRVADVLAEEQLQRRIGNELCGGGVVDPPTPIYE